MFYYIDFVIYYISIRLMLSSKPLSKDDLLNAQNEQINEHNQAEIKKNADLVKAAEAHANLEYFIKNIDFSDPVNSDPILHECEFNNIMKSIKGGNVFYTFKGVYFDKLYKKNVNYIALDKLYQTYHNYKSFIPLFKYNIRINDEVNEKNKRILCPKLRDFINSKYGHKFVKIVPDYNNRCVLKANINNINNVDNVDNVDNLSTTKRKIGHKN